MTTKPNPVRHIPRQRSPEPGAEQRKQAHSAGVATRVARPETNAGANQSPGSATRFGKAMVEAGSGGAPPGPCRRTRAPAEAPGIPADRPPRAMGLHVSKTLWPPQPGTVRPLREHGDALVCVRYRHDTAGLYRYTTVELIVDHALIGGSRFGHRLFEVAIGHGDRELRTMLMAEGSSWDPVRRIWCVSGATVRRLKLWPQVQRPLSK